MTGNGKTRIEVMGFGEIGRQIYHLAAKSDGIEVVAISDIGNRHSSIYDAAFTDVSGGRFVRALNWYDNEWGYSNRVCDLLGLIQNRL